tara:strand:- start:542 stop:1552 length:1011 start_codon:yes stop_codon:yes gene_type:complete
MKILITGVAGLIGSNLAEYYKKKNFEVFGIDNLSGGYKSNIPEGIEYHNVSCEDREKVFDIFEKNKFDYVAHCAAHAYEGLSVFAPHLICTNIISSSVSIFSAAVNSKVKRIIHFSSMARYGDIETPFYEDQSIPKPIDPYGIAKLASENILISLCKAFDVEYNIVVPHNVIGPNQKYNDPYRNVASIMINKILKNERPIIYGDGEQKRCFSDIDDCITCIDKMILDKNVKNQVINIGPDEEFVTINELSNLISNKLKFNQPPIYVTDRPLEVKHAYCSSDKARKLLNYKTKIPLSKSIDKIIHFIKTKGIMDFDYNFDLEINNKRTPKTWKNKLI